MREFVMTDDRDASKLVLPFGIGLLAFGASRQIPTVGADGVEPFGVGLLVDVGEPRPATAVDTAIPEVTSVQTSIGGKTTSDTDKAYRYDRT